DRDGDIDLFVGAQSISADYGKTPESVLLRNDSGTFTKVEDAEVSVAGMVTDAVWHDYDRDGWEDLIVVGEWMPPTIFKNESGTLVAKPDVLPNVSGLWQSIVPFDIDGDGDMDYLLGNWGENSKFVADDDFPLKMYYADFDDNGSSETVVATAKKGKYYPLEGLDELAAQMVYLRKTFTSYERFAGKTVEQVFGESLSKAIVKEVNVLTSGYLLNENGKYQFKVFPDRWQLAPIMDFIVADFDGDGKQEALAGGNYHGVKPLHGRLDAFTGGLIKNEAEYIDGFEAGLEFRGKSLREMRIINISNQPHLLTVFNNDSLQVYQYNF
ncbi:MAG: VCBS repeat-containing protein, partial [Bacteroidota bacterium]